MSAGAQGRCVPAANELIEDATPIGSSGSGTLRVIRPNADPDSRFAVRDDGNPLADDWRCPEPASAPALIVWSGSLTTDLDAAHPPNWMGAGRTALDRWWGRHADAFRRQKVRLLIRPHRRHVLSDAPSTARFLADHQADDPTPTLGLALAPMDLFEPSMLETAEDHLLRILERLGGASAMIDVRGLSADEGGPVPADVLHRLLANHVDPATPRVVGSREASGGA